MTIVLISFGFILGLAAGYFLYSKKEKKSYGTLYIDDNGTMNIKFTAPWSELFAQKNVSLKIDIPDISDTM